MKTAKVGAIFLISVMALAGVSAGYALWYDYLHLDVSVQTGYINAQFSWEDWESNQEKDVSWITYELFDDFRPEYGQIDQTEAWLQIYMHNVYPSITYEIFFNIECTGTIPIHVEPIFYNWNLIPSNDGTINVYIDEGNGYQLWDDYWIQMHPGDIFYGYIEIHFDNDLPQDLPMTHMVCSDFIYHQYNEPWE
jgi:hypothetical protein